MRAELGRPRESSGTTPPKIGPIQRFGRFLLVKKLATGGMAEIWLARQTGLAGFNRFVVIKKILSHLAEEQTFVNMFLDEARMSSNLTHPNIVQVYDLGDARGTYFIAMEYIAGENLAAIAWRGVKRKQPLSPPFAARIIADACKALHYAHHLKASDGLPLSIVHRDISPQNILVTYEGEVKVVDFGIAKAATKSQHTKTGMLKGKFSYMSPEQCLGNPVDMRSDIFALGIVLYELCTGKRLFKHESELMILEMITKRRITPPSEVAKNISTELERIILKALDKNAAARFQIAQDMQIALEEYLHAESEPSTNADISSFMRELFADKMEEKRRLCEIASRDDILEGMHEPDATEGAPATGASQAVKRRVVYGRPSDIRVSGVVPPNSSAPAPGPYGATPTGPQQTGPQWTPPHPAGHPLTAEMQFQNQSAAGVMVGGGQISEGSSWLPRLIIGLALMVIVSVSAYLYMELTASELVHTPTTAAPAKIGGLEIDSVPSGATIHVDGKAVELESGMDARTPIEELSPLEFGRTYRIKIEKKGYKPHIQRVLMGESTNKTLIKAVLEPYPSRLIVEVRGEPTDQAVEIFFNGQAKGTARLLDQTVPPGPMRITASSNGWSCAAKPESFTLEPQGSLRTTISCKKFQKRPTGSKHTPRPSRPKSGCQPIPGAALGEVTLHVLPYADIYYRGKKLGQTPLNREKLPSGCVELQAIHPPTGKKRTFRLKIRPNGHDRYRFEL